MATKSYSETVTLTVEVTFQAPRKRKDRVSAEALREHVVGELVGQEFWPSPDHDIGGADWDPAEGYTIQSVTVPKPGRGRSGRESRNGSLERLGD